MLFAVNGTLMRGLELNQNMLDAGATFVREAMTAPVYRLWSINDRYPGMVRVTEGGTAIILEVWEVGGTGLIQILEQEPPGLTIGRVVLDDHSEVLGVLAEPYLTQDKREITSFGGWRAYIASGLTYQFGSGYSKAGARLALDEVIKTSGAGVAKVITSPNTFLKPTRST